MGQRTPFLKKVCHGKGNLLSGVVILLSICTMASWTYGNDEKGHSSKTGFVNAVAIASPAVVSIQGEKQYEAAEVPRASLPGRKESVDGVTHIGMGTGIIVDPRGYIITNYHVVKGLLKIQITTSDGTIYRDVEFIRNDLKTDLALIKIKPTRPLSRIRFGKSSDVDLAEDVIAIGNPFGYQVSISRGIVSGLNRPLKASETLSYENVIQTDAAINPGNSGGPLVNIKGEMIGLNAAVREGAENIAFAIPVDVVVEVTDRMIRQTVAKMVHHGMKLTEETGMNSNTTGSLIVESVTPDSPASAAGIQVGDRLLTSNGFDVHTPIDFTCSLIDVTLMDTVNLTVQRGQEKMETKLAFAVNSDNNSSDLLAMKVNRPVQNGQNELRFNTADTAPSYAFSSDNYELSTLNVSLVSLPPEEVVRGTFGMVIESVSADKYKQLYPQLSVVSLGNSKIYPAGGVRVIEIDAKSLLRRQGEKIEKDDLLFGIILGDSEDNRWGITSVDDLSYIAQKLHEMKAENDRVKARIYLIRDNVPYFLDLSL